MAAGTRRLGPKYQDQAGGPGVRVVWCPSGGFFLPTSVLGVKFHSQCTLLTTQKLDPLLKKTKPCVGSWVGGANRGPGRGSQQLRAAPLGSHLGGSSPGASLHGGPAGRRVLEPVLGEMGELGVVTVVTAPGVLQVQDGRALDREGWPLRRGLLAEF